MLRPLKSALFALLVLASSICSSQEQYTMFTWLPQYHELGAIERSRMSKSRDDWQVAIHEGIFDTEVDSAQLKANGIPLSQVENAFKALPSGTSVIWHVGWWHNAEGFATPSEFMVPNGEDQDWVHNLALQRGINITYSQGDI